jgi:peptidyl-prolyl cis-trans isomerase D
MVLTEAFRNDIGFEGDLLSTEQDGYFVLRVDDVTPSALKSFDSVIEAVRTSFLKTKRSKKLGEIAESIGERAKGGSTFEALANEIGRTILSTTPDIGRGDNDETFSLQLISKAFAANIDDFVNGPTSFGESWIVATPRKSIKQSLAMNAAQVEALMEQLGQSTLQDLLDQYYTALGDRLGVKTYPNVIDTTLGVVAE